MPPTTMQRWIPWGLVGLRLALAPISVALVWTDAPRWVWLLQFALAILSDVYDGKLARRWGVASPGLRRADSIVDDVYGFACLACFWLAEPDVLRPYLWAIGALVTLDLLRTPLDWWRFGKRASYHAWSMRTFGASLLVLGLLLMGTGDDHGFLPIALGIGLFAELEGLAMTFVLPRWTHDVAHLGRAIALRREHQQVSATESR